MKNLSSYVPETFHTSPKRQNACRLFWEELAVVDPEKDFCILASRGNSLPVGSNFFKTCGVLLRDSALLRSHLPKERRFLLPASNGCVLMLGDLLGETGLFLGLLLPQDAEDVLCALLRMGRGELVAPPELLPKGGLLSRPYDEELCRRLEELFYYLDRILIQTPEASLWTRCLLIANFVGCRLERVALPVEAPRLSKGDDACMTMFLICSFLTLRQKNGRVQAEGVTLDTLEKEPNYRCTVSFFEESDELLKARNDEEEVPVQEDPPLFLQTACFSAHSLCPLDGGLRLETRFLLPQKDPVLGAYSASRWFARLKITVKEYEKNDQSLQSKIPFGDL